MNFEVCETDEGFRTFRVRNGEDEILINPTPDPLESAREWVDGTFDRPSSILLVGTDCLYPVRALLELSSLKKLYLIEYWDELWEATLEQFDGLSCLEDDRVTPLFDRSVKELVDFFREEPYNRDSMEIARTPVSGQQNQANRKAYEILRDVVFQSVPADVHGAIQEALDRDKPLEDGDLGAAWLFIDQLTSRFERKDIDYDLLP
jgi:hypothetical protein